MMARQFRCCLAVFSFGCAAALAQSPKPASGTPRTVQPISSQRQARQKPADNAGGITGQVTDSRGVAQAGVAVTIIRQDGGFSSKVYTLPSGRFRISHLPPGTYAAEIAQPSFVPFSKSAIAVEAGAEFLLNVSLLSLADSMQVGVPPSLKDAADSWKWVLRSGYPERPILRLQPPLRNASASVRDPRERALRGSLQFFAGNESHGFGQDPGLRTSFDFAYGLPNSQDLALAGSAGWERGTPAASLRAAWDRRTGDNSTSTVSMTVRQLFLPTEYWSGSTSASNSNRVQSLTMGYEEERILGDHARLQVGGLYDTLNFGSHLTRWSPFARLTYLPTNRSRITFAYTAANPRVLPFDGDTQRNSADQTLAIPQISAGAEAEPVLEGGRHIETQWDQQFSGGIRVQAAVFYDDLSETALSVALPSQNGSQQHTQNDFARGLLRDPFSDRYFLSGGNSSAPGARVAVAAHITPATQLILGYGYAEALETPADEIFVQNASELRSAIRSHGEHSFTVKTVSRIPLSATRLIASYRWLPGNVVAPSDPYDRGIAQSDMFLNLYVVQPIPSPEILQGQFQAVAGFTNLLAQGYMTVHGPAASTGTLFPSARAFHGGFNFIF